MQLIGSILGSARFDLQNEKILQAQISDLLARKGIEHTREVELIEGDIIDFMINEVGIEVKISGAAKSIYRQCCRYCEHDAVQTFILVTNKAITLPHQINNKPTCVINLGRAWL